MVADMYAIVVLDMLGARGVPASVYESLAWQAGNVFIYPAGQPPATSGLPISNRHETDRDAVVLRLSLLSGEPAGFEGFYDFMHNATCIFMQAGYLVRGG